MNGKNKILIGCLALLLVMSIGYALFSDTITINGTATAKGDFNLVITCDEVVPNNVKNLGSITDAKITCEGNVVNASATLGYPGSEKWFRVMVKNEGTIPARLTEVVELNNPDLMFFNIEQGHSGTGIYNCQGDTSNEVCAELFLGDTVWDDYNSTESIGFEGDWNSLEFNNPILDPEETAYFYIYMVWYRASTIPGDPLTANLKSKFTWQQVTVE